MKVVAKRGFSATLSMPRKSFTITQFNSFDLDQFTQEQLDKSNLEILLENGWVEEYTNQVLPKGPKPPEIPQVQSAIKQGQGEKDNEVTLSVKRNNEKRVVTEVSMPADLPQNLHARAEADKTLQAEEAKRHVKNVKKTTADDVDSVPRMKSLKVKDITQGIKIKVGGRIIVDEAKEEFKMPKAATSEDNSEDN